MEDLDMSETSVTSVAASAPTFTPAQVGLSFLHTPSGRTFGLAIAPGVIPLADGCANSVFVVEQINGVWGLCIGDGAEIIIGVGASVLSGTTAAAYITAHVIPIANEYFAVNVFPAAAPVSPPAPGTLTDAEAIAELLAGFAKILVAAGTTPPVLSLPEGAVTD
jgi:hypothetical protein